MVEHPNWNLAVRAGGGPKLTQSGSMVADAYDELSVVLPAGREVDLDLGPTAAGRICRCGEGRCCS